MEYNLSIWPRVLVENVETKSYINNKISLPIIAAISILLLLLDTTTSNGSSLFIHDNLSSVHIATSRAAL